MECLCSSQPNGKLWGWLQEKGSYLCHEQSSHGSDRTRSPRLEVSGQVLTFSFFVLFFFPSKMLILPNNNLYSCLLQAWNFQCWKRRVSNSVRRTAKSLNGVHGLHAKISVLVVGVVVLAIPILPWQPPRRPPRQCPPPLL